MIDKFEFFELGHGLGGRVKGKIIGIIGDNFTTKTVKGVDVTIVGGNTNHVDKPSSNCASA